jgi:ankyrin repeat protein
VRLLLERKDVDIDSKNIYGHTALSLAELYGHEALVRLLLEFKGVNANTEGHDSRTLTVGSFCRWPQGTEMRLWCSCC